MVKLNWGIRACGISLLWAAAAVALPAQTFTTLASFDGTDGKSPFSGLVQGTDGNLYGVTFLGGTGYGNVFSITTTGTLTSLYPFCSNADCTDGDFPIADVVQGTDGYFYGTTTAGGTKKCGRPGCGTFFRISPSGTLKTLHSFNGEKGSYPSVLIQGNEGLFYGIAGGGANRNGTIYTITPSGMETPLYNFCAQPKCTDGAGPNVLIQAANGNFYGTTAGGGAYGCGKPRCGTVFSITPGGTLTTLLSFNERDGKVPEGLVQGADGNFYGTTNRGGLHHGGTIFRMTPAGMLTTIYNFCTKSNCTDGSSPTTDLVQGSDLNLYGTTYSGGTNTNSSCPSGCGTIFKVTSGGAFMTLYDFCSQGGSSCTDGNFPVGLVQDTNGTFYGTAREGGTSSACDDGCGTVFSLSVGLGPFVETQPTSRRVGRTVRILGTNLTGATSVTFNGTPATFTVVSASEITTTVPMNATTGPVQVVTPGGTLSSNVPFRVTTP
jgi:uncharacterized repeat protein (TIGR03803 family)